MGGGAAEAPCGGSRCRLLKIEARGYESKFWRYASPILALLLTGATSGLIFAAMGRPPGLTVYTFLVAPLLQQDGLQALVVKAAPLIMMGVGLSLAYRANVWNIGTDGQFTLGAICGGGLALAFPDAPAWAIFPAMMVAGAARRHAERRAGGLAAHPVQRQRDPDQPDVRLHHPVSAGVSRHRTMARPAGLRLSADRAVLGQRAGAAADRGHQRSYRHPAGAADRHRLVVHAGEIAAGLSVPGAGPGDPRRAVRRLQREPAGLDRHADQRRAGRAGRPAGGDRHAGAADHDPVARLWLHRDHRGVSWPAQSAGRHSGGAAAGADLPRRRCGADQPGAAERGDRDFPGHPAVLPAGLRHPVAEPFPLGVRTSAKAAR